MKKIITSIIFAFALVPVQGQNVTININNGDVNSDTDEPAILVNGELLPETVRIKDVGRYLYRQGLTIAEFNFASGDDARKKYEGKFGGRDITRVIDFNTEADTLSEAYIKKHPKAAKNLFRIEGYVVDDETNKPLPNVWVNYKGWIFHGAETDDKGHFVMWYINNHTELQASCAGHETVKDIKPTDAVFTIRMKQAQPDYNPDPDEYILKNGNMELDLRTLKMKINQHTSNRSSMHNISNMTISQGGSNMTINQSTSNISINQGASNIIINNR